MTRLLFIEIPSAITQSGSVLSVWLIALNVGLEERHSFKRSSGSIYKRYISLILSRRFQRLSHLAAQGGSLRSKPPSSLVSRASYMNGHVEQQGVSSWELHGAHLALVGTLVGRGQVGGGGRGQWRGIHRRRRARSDRSQIVRRMSWRSSAPNLK